MYVNNVTLSGRLAADPLYYPDANDPNKNRAWFRLAINRIGQDKADFICCTAWGKKADVMAKYGKKGKVIAVEGSLRENNQPKADGTGHTNYTEVSVRLVHLGADAKQQGQPDVQAPQQFAPPVQPGAPVQQFAPAPDAVPFDPTALAALAAALSQAQQASASLPLASSPVAPAPMPGQPAPDTF